MKKIVVILTAGVLALSLVGCSSGSKSSSTSETAVDESSSTQTIEQVDLDNLEVGDTAYFKDYSITVSNVEVVDGVTNVDVTMATNKKSTFATRYMDAKTTDGRKVSADKLADMTIDADDTYRTLLTYKATNIDTLIWDNWNNEAEWHLYPIATTDEASVTTNSDDLFYGWEAVKQYGEHAYPYGFKLHYILDNQVEDNLYGDTWHLVASCDIRNEYGKWARGLICNAVVTGSGEDWVVDSFSIE